MNKNKFLSTAKDVIDLEILALKQLKPGENCTVPGRKIFARVHLARRRGEAQQSESEPHQGRQNSRILEF